MALTRRRFLRTLVVSASSLSVLGLAGCDDDNNTAATPPPPQPTPASITVTEALFPQSVMSGDPTENSVILWTRLTGFEGSSSLMLQVASDEKFDDLLVDQRFDVSEESDGCLKIRVEDLQPGSHYYYRFMQQNSDGNYLSSRTGRTKTAPAADADVAVKFGFVSCQDYLGRYYNTYLSLLAQDDLDFVLHLGDYIYETSGDSSFQQVGGERSIEFNDSDGTIQIGSGDDAYQAAASVDNYRQLYQTYRGDALLQRIHERFPLVAIWDDHEFSDDSWQTNATYFDGAMAEQQLQRKRNAEQVYFEYMPLDHAAPHGDSGTGALSISDEQLFPNTKIYRQLRFGQHLDLALTDYRTFRPDHLIPEDAFPATVAMDSQTVSGFLTSLGIDAAVVAATVAQLSPVINIDDAAMAPYKAAFTEIATGLYAQELGSRLGLTEAEALAQGQARAVAAVQGKLTSSYLNLMLAGAKASLPAAHPIQGLPALPESGVDTGLAFYTMGKTSLFGNLGSRYLVIKDSFDVYAAYQEYLAQQQGGTAQIAYDVEQFAWLQTTLASSTASNKVMASSVSFAPLLADLSSSRVSTNVPMLEGILDSALVPPALKQRFYLNADHWDGLPQFKSALVNELLSATGTVTVSGDIHASFVTEHPKHASTGLGSVDFTTSSVSSGSFGSFLDAGLTDLLGQLGDVPEEIGQLKYFFDAIALASSSRDDVDSKLRLAKMWEHGVGVMTANASGVAVEYHNVPAVLNGVDYIKQSFYDNPEAFLAQVRIHRINWDGSNLTVAEA
ncbi:alkaline phosphatase D family protein [uncultured Ferrimonas sp.]|uniref:alkaline phosphatase D family protein n=1 Tax=uncultured Ferrimonas sp. TaxID=432640 RepID=UPI002632566B|nr:alkaline phosphatase D family protein [uncultured Ferrimonas sp.]